MVDELFELDDEGTVIVRVHVQPGAGRSEVVGRHGHALKVRVAAAPEGGRGNDACSRLLAEVFGLRSTSVALLSGSASRSKRFALSGIEPDDVRDQLERLLRPTPTTTPSHRPSRR